MGVKPFFEHYIINASIIHRTTWDVEHTSETDISQVKHLTEGKGERTRTLYLQKADWVRSF